MSLSRHQAFDQDEKNIYEGRAISGYAGKSSAMEIGAHVSDAKGDVDFILFRFSHLIWTAVRQQPFDMLEEMLLICVDCFLSFNS